MPPRAPLLRIPYTDPLPAPRIIPASAATSSGAIAALVNFLSPSLPSSPSRSSSTTPASASSGHTVLLTGAGISVASGLADYRGTAGTYTLNRTYRPIYYNEFCASHEARKRYWARSFLGWTNLVRAKANAGHVAVGDLGRLGVVGSVVTQNVDSFHPLTHPALSTIELHGYLRTLTCLTCATSYPRSSFQHDLSRLNPSWATFLASMLETGALDTENPLERSKRGLKTNPDGDVDIPGAEYTTFRYPACPTCLKDGKIRVEVDTDGAWTTPAGGSGAGGAVLKPSVVMFGESIPAERKVAAEKTIDDASRILVVGSSLATYSAWRLVKRAKERNMPIGILNIGGCRGEDTFYANVQEEGNAGREAVRCSERADVILPQVVQALQASRSRDRI
ncbi:DHS-like NAD/FAD-binding domain-containing protein [Massarina eburnea CBS 473.64]|uniref:DHS-like NAD/FAD-binding domain-containing protein n=1 Tax=Massarina eburnea CBS 473.64 TaxID=1395130 RepID=A0A6A6SB74_9PLEO|nr:DHS-like NAD/FAD-binding domain-containing protein [Massarina eburnea CBS 473.64]